jgi:amino acid permease
MMEDELIKIWQSSPNQERIKFEKSKLMMEVQSSLDRFHKSIKYRDLMETIPAIFILPFLLHIAYTIPFTLSKIGAIWCVISGIYIIIRLSRAKKNKPSAFTETYRDYLNKTKEYLFVG